jgi:hypothetical protein
VYDNKVYLADNNPEYYDGASGTWKNWITPPYTMNYDACMVVWRDSFIMLGYGKFQKFSLATQTWSIITANASAPTNLYNPGCAVLPNEEILVVGGVFSGQATYVYNVVSNTWRATANTINTQAATSLVYLNKRLFALGGSTNIAEEFNFSSYTWSSVPTPQIYNHQGYAGAMDVPADMFSSRPGGCKGIN